MGWTRTLATFVLLLAVGVAHAKDRPCTCRYAGEDMPEGSTVCIDLASGTYLARCEWVLNNTAWRKVADGCGIG